MVIVCKLRLGFGKRLAWMVMFPVQRSDDFKLGWVLGESKKGFFLALNRDARAMDFISGSETVMRLLNLRLLNLRLLTR